MDADIYDTKGRWKEAGSQSHSGFRVSGVQSAKLENHRLLCHMDADYGNKLENIKSISLTCFIVLLPNSHKKWDEILKNK